MITPHQLTYLTLHVAVLTDDALTYGLLNQLSETLLHSLTSSHFVCQAVGLSSSHMGPFRPVHCLFPTAAYLVAAGNTSSSLFFFLAGNGNRFREHTEMRSITLPSVLGTDVTKTKEKTEYQTVRLQKHTYTFCAYRVT